MWVFNEHPALDAQGKDLKRQQSTVVKRMDIGAGQTRSEYRFCHLLLMRCWGSYLPQFLQQKSGDISFAYFSGLLWGLKKITSRMIHTTVLVHNRCYEQGLHTPSTILTSIMPQKRRGTKAGHRSYEFRRHLMLCWSIICWPTEPFICSSAFPRLQCQMDSRRLSQWEALKEE